MSERRPNIIFILCDQFRYDAGGFAGNPVVQTPVLDEVAEEGVCFTNAYCASPVCSPSRASYLTGLYPHAHLQLANYGHPSVHRKRTTSTYGDYGHYLPADATTIGDILHDAGYRCGITGPWHLGKDETPQHGFYDMWATVGYQDPETDQYVQHLEEHDLAHIHQQSLCWVCNEATGGRVLKQEALVGTCILPTEHQQTSWLVDRAIDFCEQGNSPFFLILSIKDPHPAWYPPEETLALYEPEKMPMPDNPNDPLIGKPQFLNDYPWTLAPQGNRDDEQLVMAHYFAVVTHIDQQLGRLFSFLDKQRIAQDTIIAFASDHGEMLGDHGFLYKMLMYESSVRVPLLLRWPDRLPAGLRVSTPVAGVDLMPTLLELADVPVPRALHGLSVAEAITEGREPRRHPVLAEVGSFERITDPEEDEAGLAMAIMVLKERWKYICHRYDIDELYNLEVDPNEMTNLVDQPEQRSAVEEMRRLLVRELTRDGRAAGAYQWCIEQLAD